MVCGERIPPGSDTATATAVRNHRPIAWACGQTCRGKLVGRAQRMATCRHCRRPFTVAAAADAPGRPREYCTNGCRSNADRRRARLWRNAAKQKTPGSPEECHDLYNQVTQLISDIVAERRVHPVPDGAVDLLRRYAKTLSAAKTAADRALAEDRKARRRERTAAAAKEHADAEREATQRYVKDAAKGADDE